MDQEPRPLLTYGDLHMNPPASPSPKQYIYGNIPLAMPVNGYDIGSTASWVSSTTTLFSTPSPESARLDILERHVKNIYVALQALESKVVAAINSPTGGTVPNLQPILDAVNGLNQKVWDIEEQVALIDSEQFIIK